MLSLVGVHFPSLAMIDGPERLEEGVACTPGDMAQGTGQFE
ncbi:hypothetical protein ACFL5O_07885 [Myxococcota bacterium]